MMIKFDIKIDLDLDRFRSAVMLKVTVIVTEMLWDVRCVYVST